MMKRTYKIKKTISIKQFNADLGEGFTKHLKQRLLELGERCLLTRGEEYNILDLRHIEHTKYECSSSKNEKAPSKKEYAYGQLIVKDGALYFSNSCVENDDIMQNPIVNEIYEALGAEEVSLDNYGNAKKVDDENIDFIIDSILKVCPEMSAEHMAILAKYSTPDKAVVNR